MRLQDNAAHSASYNLTRMMSIFKSSQYSIYFEFLVNVSLSFIKTHHVTIGKR